MCAFFLGEGCGGIVVHLFSMVSFFASTCPIRSGVGTLDNPDQSGQRTRSKSLVFRNYFFLWIGTLESPNEKTELDGMFIF